MSILFSIFVVMHWSVCVSFSSQLPAVNASWRPKDVQLPFETQYPLTMDMMIKGFPKLRDEQIYRFASFFRKVHLQKEVKILVLGGSFTFGTKCCEHHAWPERLAKWLRRAYPGTNIHFISRALGSTSSLFGMQIITEYNDVDLLFVDYSLNDAGSLAVHKEGVMLAVTENIVRYMTEKGSAVVYVAENMYGELLEEVYSKVLDYYNASLVSYRAAVKTEVLAAEKRIEGKLMNSIFWTKQSWQPHPNWVTHQLLAEMMATFLTIVGDKLQGVISLDHQPVLDLPPPLFPRDNAVGTKLAGLVMCKPALSVYSTIDTDSPSRSFDPFVFYKHKTPPHYYIGWNFTVDVPGKPLGWIADSSTRPSSQPAAHIAFPILLSSGRVSVTYLSSYENCGKLEIWLSYIDYSTMSGTVSTGAADVIGCCNNTAEKVAFYPHVKGMHFSNSAFLDTLDTSARVSEMRTITLTFGVPGSFVINLLHTRLPEEELRARGGDKVKLLGIKSC